MIDLFFESDNIWVHDDPANNITTMCSMLGKEGIICVPSNVSSFADMSYCYACVTMVLDYNGLNTNIQVHESQAETDSLK